MTKILESITNFCTTRSWLVLVIVVLMTLGAASGLTRLVFDNSPDAYFLEGDDSVAKWQAFKTQYASDEFSFVVVSSENADLNFITTLRSLTETFKDLDAAERVTSIINVRSIRSVGDDLDVGDYLREDLPAVEQLERLREANKHPYYGGLYVSQDGKEFGVMIETDPEITNEEKAILTDEIRTILTSSDYAELNGRAIGAPVLDTDVQRIVSAESGLFGTLTMGLVLLGFALSYRSLLGVILPVIVALPSILATLGLHGYSGAPAGLLTPIIPSFLISVGLGTAVYLLTKFHTLRRTGIDTVMAINKTMVEAGGPAIMANATTAFALFAFSSSRIQPVQDVGLALGTGLLIALFLTLLLFPILAKWTGPRISRKFERPEEEKNMLLHSICQVVLNRPIQILGVFVLLVITGIMGILQLKTDYYYLGTFKSNTQIVKSYDSAAAAIPVANTIEVIIDTGIDDAFQTPNALRALDQLTERALLTTNKALPIKAYSLADVVKELALETNRTNSIPNDRQTIAQLLLLFESSGTDELTRVTTPAYDQARLTLMVPARPYSAYNSTIEMIQAEGPKIFSEAGFEQVEITVTGVVPLWLRLTDFLSETQIHSFSLAVIVVALIMVAVVRNLILGLTMATINLGCVLIVLGAMGWLGIHLDPFTILIGAIAIGILDDDTIHFSVTALNRFRNGRMANDAISDTYQSAGRAMGLQTMVLLVAFLVYSLSSVASLTLFGILTAITILIGLLAEYFVTPAVIYVLFKGKEQRFNATES